MAAAVLTRSSNDSPHSKMSSPKDSKRNLLGKSEDTPIKRELATEEAKPANSSAGTSNAQPLAPPPRPAQGAGSDAPDYFNQVHQPTQFSLEPNPFEQSFGNPSAETPGKSILPPVASITSPSPLQGVTPGWSSLRAGPLSPAMLAGPQTSTDYFSESFRGGFPTPNESSLRTGLTPGGGGSMFPQPSPNSQALFNLQSGGATPSTLDFHRTALAANTKFNLSASGPTSQPEATATASASQFPTQQNAQGVQPQAQVQRGQQELIGSNHDVNTAANDLLQFSSGARNGIFAVPTQPPTVNTGIPMQGQVQESSPTARRGTKGSIGTSISAGSVDPGDQSESGHSEQAKPASRSRSKKATNNKTQPKRKTEETPVKTPVNKKHKANTGTVSPDEDEDSDMETSPKGDLDANGKKMTDEEKRKNFLERNRVAALKCRQRKKQWLASLQAKVEAYSTENDALSAQVAQLREELISVKAVLLAHKDCPVAQAQGLSGIAMTAFVGGDVAVNHHANPYGMAMQANGLIPMAGAAGQMQRT